MSQLVFLVLSQLDFKKAGFHSLCATIRTGQESRCLPYAGFVGALFGKVSIRLILKAVIEIKEQPRTKILNLWK